MSPFIPKTPTFVPDGDDSMPSPVLVTFQYLRLVAVHGSVRFALLADFVLARFLAVALHPCYTLLTLDTVA